MVIDARHEGVVDALREYDCGVLEGRGDAAILTQTARFKPRGLAGLIYWAIVTPFHGFVFQRMLEGIRQRVETGSAEPRDAGNKGKAMVTR